MGNFENAVKSTPDIQNGYRKGLQALGANSKYVSANNNSQIEGSVDIDNATHAKYPTASRWDYVVGYNEVLYFIEVHPASSGKNVDEMLAKYNWLKSWLSQNASLLNANPNKKYRWVRTGKVSIPTSQATRKLQQAGISPVGTVKME